MKIVTNIQAGAPRRYIAYYRVSTDKQGQSGLGLEAQRQLCGQYIEAYGGRDASLVGEFTDIQSGRSNLRPQLLEALAECRRSGATLIVAKLDRLARNARFLSELVDGDVDVVFGNLPQLPPGSVGRFMVQIMASIAELESGMISDRTKAALEQAKKRGVKLGGAKNTQPTEDTRRLGYAAKKAKADKFANQVIEHMRDAQRAGASSLSQIAAYLNQRGVTTARGQHWTSTQVHRVLQRLEAAEQRRIEEAKARAKEVLGVSSVRRNNGAGRGMPMVRLRA